MRRFVSMEVDMRMWWLALVLGVSLPATAQERRLLSPDDLWALKRVGSPAVSPDGRSVAYTVTTYDMNEDRSNADLWLLSIAGDAPRQLTTNKASDSSPAWSPDGARIAFVSKREGDGAAQLYLIPVGGGEAQRLTDMPLDVASPRWLPDGKRIAFLSSVIAGSESPELTKKAVELREKSKVKARVTENRLYRYWDRWLTEDEFPHIFVLDVATRKVTDLLPGSTRYFALGEDTSSFEVSPDGGSIAFSANSTPAPYRTLNRDVFVVSTSGGTPPQNLTSDNAGDDVGPVFSPDGKRIAYGLERKADGWPDYARLAIKELGSGKTQVLTEGWEQSVRDARWTPDGQALVFHAEARARTNLYRIPAAGGAAQEIHHGGTTAGAQPLADGRVVFAVHSIDRPAELAVVGLDGKGFQVLTHVNDALMATLSLGAVKDVTFKGAAGDEVQMFVVYPPGFDAKSKYPLLQVVHGGPVGTSGDAFSYRWNAHTFAAPGYIVAMVNFHGSASFGQAWVESILGAHPDKPFTDVMKATDFLIAQGNVEPTRMAAAGGSYGGFLVDWIAGHTDRFRCLVSHAGVYDLLAQFSSDGTYGRHHSYGGYPFTNLANIERWSPNRFAANIKTPMLILHGERDFRVPVTQGLELYGVLTAKGVPARLVYYPDEHHWILKGQNSRHWYGEVLDWLAKYLK
jgi:dipeptidyl aminopeptidase/acylaminoacyl peptidase